MKIFSYIIVFFAVFFGFLYFLLFTQNGNNLLKPYLSYFASKKTGQKIVIQNLILKPNHINTSLKLNDGIDINVDGDFNLFGKKINLLYEINAKEIKTKKESIKSNINLKGSVKGDLNHIEINGKGEAFSSPINYSLQIIDKIIKNIKANIKNGKIEELLGLINQSEYLKGVFDLFVDIPKLDPKNLNGTAQLNIHKSFLNQEAIKKDFNITIPKGSFIKAQIKANLKGKYIQALGDIESSFADLKLDKTLISIEKGIEIKSDYELITKNQNIGPIVKMPLRGEIKAHGSFFLKGKEFNLKAKSDSFKGESSFETDGKTLLFSLNNGSIEKILYILGQEELSSGKLNIKAKFSDLKNLKGKINIETRDSHFNPKIIKRAYKIELPKNSSYKFVSSLDFLKDKILIEANIKSFIDMNIKNGIYKLKDASFKSNYIAYIKDLGSLEPIIKKKLKGDIKITGEIKKEGKNLIITGKSKKFEGDIDLVMKNSKIDFQAYRLRVKDILDMALYPKIADGIADINASYDIITKKGEAFAKIDKARILPNTLTDLIATFTKHDFTKERFNQTTLKSKIERNHLTFTLLARSEHSYISFKNAKIDTQKNTIYAPFDIFIKKKDIKGVIEGNINKPKIKIDTSKYLKEKAINKVEKLIEKKFNKKGKENKKIETIKGILNLFKK